MNIRLALTAMVSATVILSLAEATSAEDRAGSVLYIVPTLDDEAYIRQLNAAKEEARKYPEIAFEFTAGSGRNVVPEIIAKIESGVTRGFDVIVIDPGEAGEQLTPALRKALESGVKVVTNSVPVPMLKNPTSRIEFDDKAATVPGGRFMAERLSAGDEVVMIRCFIGNGQMDAFADGFLEGIKGSGINVVATGEAHCNALEARALMENWLTVSPNLKGVFSDADIALLGALEALEAANVDPIVVGNGAMESIVEMIDAGRIVDASAIYPFWSFGVLGVQTAARLVRGETVPERVIVPVEGLVTQENAKKFIKG